MNCWCRCWEPGFGPQIQVELGAVACISNPHGPTGRWRQTGQRQRPPHNSYSCSLKTATNNRDTASNKMEGQGPPPEVILQPLHVWHGMCMAELIHMNQCSYTQHHNSHKFKGCSIKPSIFSHFPLSSLGVIKDMLWLGMRSQHALLVVHGVIPFLCVSWWRVPSLRT